MDEKSFESISEAHRCFAVHLHGQTRDLLETGGRSDFESGPMLHAAHASLYHCLQVVSQVNHQRGEWLIGSVQVVLGRPVEALPHAGRTLELTEAHPGLMEDFDVAFAYEGLARAHALAEDYAQAGHWLSRAREAGMDIGDPDDQVVFFDGLKGGDWYGPNGG